MGFTESSSGQRGVVTVGIAELGVSDDPAGELVTYGLGSCVALLVHDPVRKVAGMLHFMLPTQASAPQRADDSPTMFADSGVPLLFQRLYAKGCQRHHLVVKVVGGGSFHEAHRSLDIGLRNRAVLHTLLDEAGVFVRAEDVGGSRSRTVRLSVGSGRVQVSSDGRVTEL